MRGSATALQAAMHKPLIEIRPSVVLLRTTGIYRIEYKTGDTLPEDAEAPVNTATASALWGAAWRFSSRTLSRGTSHLYSAACKRNEVQPRADVSIRDRGQLTNPRYNVNFPPSAIGVARAHRGYRCRSHRAGGRNPIAEYPINRCSTSGSGPCGRVWTGPKIRCRIEATLRGLSEVKIVVFEPATPTAAMPLTSI